MFDSDEEHCNKRKRKECESNFLDANKNLAKTLKKVGSVLDELRANLELLDSSTSAEAITSLESRPSK
jgi:phage-related minor tail protein